MASNETSLADEDGEFSDWIEILNPDDDELNLEGYFLTDEEDRLSKWTFPARVLAPGERVLVFASGKDRDVGELHSNFRLSASGEYLALVSPDGLTTLSDFGEKYPPQFEDESYGVGVFGIGYFDSPTPGEENAAGRVSGPQFLEVRRGGARPQPAESLVINATVSEAAEVTLFYRTGFEEEQSIAMTSDDGENFSISIPGAGAGQLIRWRFVAQDLAGRVTREPPFRDPVDSHEYFGVPVSNPDVESNAQVMEWFIPLADYRRLVNFQAVRAGIYFLGEYYDNVRFTLHGQSSLFFNKKSFNMDFNRTQRFRWKEGEARVKDHDLLTNWGDKSKSRNELAYRILREAGVPTHVAETIRLQRNGEFFSLTDMIEDADDLYLERAGLDPEGTLYKAEDITLSLSDLDQSRPLKTRVRKLTRKDGDLSDLADFIRGLNRSGEEVWDYVYDHVDLPMTINTLAGLTVIMQADMFQKNYYIYRDTEGDGEWALLPWDLDLSFGRVFTDRAGYFDQTLFAEGFTEFEESAKIIRLVDLLIDEGAATRAMFFRRLRTLADEFLASNYLRERSTEQLQRLSPPGVTVSDAFRDSFTWGTWFDNNPVPQAFSSVHPDAETMERAINRLLDEWLPKRRFELFESTFDLPSEQVNPAIMIGTLDFDPISDDQDQEFVELINQSASAADVSGWSLSGAVEITLPPGTVIPAGSSLFLSPNKASFRTRDLSPTGGEQRLVVGPYSGNLSAEGETIDLHDPEGELRDSKTYSGRNPGFNGNSREDLDGDGLSALLEWALASSDREFNGLSAPRFGEFTYTARSELNGFELHVETSADLVNWERNGAPETQRVAQEGGLDLVTVQLPHGNGPCFLRVVLERAP